MHGNNTAPTTMYVDDNNPPTKIGLNVQQNQMQTNRAPVTMSIGDNVGRAPTTMYVGRNVERAPTTMYTEPIQNGTGPPTHVSMELYQKAVNAISNWSKVHKNDVEEKKKKK